MTQEAINRTVRKSTRSRTLGANAQCAICGLRDPRMLERHHGRVLCYEHAREQEGKSRTERHHVHGRAVDNTKIEVPGNLHRILSDFQHDHPSDPPDASPDDPLLWLAKMFRSLRDHLMLWVEWLEHIASWFVKLSGRLRAHFGPTWWVELEIEPLSEELPA